MKYSQNGDTLLFLLSFAMDQHKTKYWKILFANAGAQKRWKTVSSGSTLTQYLQNPKSNFPAKYIFT